MTAGNKKGNAIRRKTTTESNRWITPKWAAFAIIVSMTFMVSLAVNFRAYSSVSKEAEQHDVLNVQLENLTNENMALQEEIHNIKNDSRTIEREVKKNGPNRSTEKVPLPAN